MSEESIIIFDRAAARRHRDRVTPSLSDYDFLFREVADRLADRLDDVRRTFPLALDLGCHDGTFARVAGARGGIETLVQSDFSPGMAEAARRAAGSRAGIGETLSVGADEELLPFAERTFDLIVSSMTLQWVNDLPGVLLQINHALKPDGLFLAAMPGGDTLWELRQSLTAAEIELEEGAGPRVSPFAQLQDAAALMQRAGFALPVCDVDTITVTYPNALKLMDDLRGMGEANAVRERRKGWSRRETLLRAVEIYQENHGDEGGKVPATFQILYLTGWRPAPDQPQPLRPGQAQARMADVLGTQERSTGVKAEPSGSRPPKTP